MSNSTIKIREPSGSTHDVDPQKQFVEIYGPDNTLVCVVWVSNTGEVKIAKSGSEELTRYKNIMGVRVSDSKPKDL